MIGKQQRAQTHPTKKAVRFRRNERTPITESLTVVVVDSVSQFLAFLLVTTRSPVAQEADHLRIILHVNQRRKIRFGPLAQVHPSREQIG